MWYPELKRSQINRICFTMVDANYQEVPGLGAVFSVFISKNGTPPFVPSAAFNKAEIGNGWYTALLPAVECDTIGPVAIYVTGAGCIQQNLEYVVQQRNAGCIEYTYIVNNSVSLNPLEDVEVWVSIDLVAPPTNIVWYGRTDVFGVARDENGNLPCLDAGTYYFWKEQMGFIDDQNPDTEVVSP